MMTKSSSNSNINNKNKNKKTRQELLETEEAIQQWMERTMNISFSELAQKRYDIYLMHLSYTLFSLMSEEKTMNPLFGGLITS